MKQTPFLIIHNDDNVMIALMDLKQGQIVNDITLTEDVLKGHKIALKDIQAGEDIIKYGFPIGHATKDIKTGAHVHVHNLATNLNDVLDYQYTPQYESYEVKPKNRDIYVYRRANGEVGIRNELWIVPTVGCMDKPNNSRIYS